MNTNSSQQPSTVPAYVAPPAAPKSRRNLFIGIAVVLLLIAGGGTWLGIKTHNDNEARDRAEARAAAKERAEKEAEEERLATIQACKDQLGPYVEALSDINARLDVGISQSDYSDALGEASIKRSRIDLSQLSSECKSGVLDVADDAFDAYTLVNSDWNDCIFDTDCDTDTDLDTSSWTSAGEDVDEAKAALATGGDPTTDS